MIEGIGMCGFRLRWADQSIEIDAVVVLGRGEDCDVVIDDPLVSRRHATVVRSDSDLWVHDLGSRNGVHVNGERVQDRRRLLVGDSFRIGGREMSVEGDQPTWRIADTVTPGPTKRIDALGIVGQLAGKALALGRIGEAERLVSGPMEQVLREALTGLAPTNDVLDKSTDLAVRLLEATRRGFWMDWLVRVYAALGKPWPAPVVDTLYQVARGCVRHDRQALRSYCEVLRAAQNELGPAERFQVGRIAGLERVLSAQ